MRTCHLAVVIVHTNYILSSELVALTKPSGSHEEYTCGVETRAQHVLLHTGLELHAVAPSYHGSEKKIYSTVSWSTADLPSALILFQEPE